MVTDGWILRQRACAQKQELSQTAENPFEDETDYTWQLLDADAVMAPGSYVRLDLATGRRYLGTPAFETYRDPATNCEWHYRVTAEGAEWRFPSQAWQRYVDDNENTAEVSGASEPPFVSPTDSMHDQNTAEVSGASEPHLPTTTDTSSLAYKATKKSSVHTKVRWIQNQRRLCHGRNHLNVLSNMLLA